MAAYPARRRADGSAGDERGREQDADDGADGSAAPVWSPWQKINVQISARAVSPVVYDGRLHVFWIDVKSKSQNQIQNGSSNFSGYAHTMKLYFTTP